MTVMTRFVGLTWTLSNRRIDIAYGSEKMPVASPTSAIVYPVQNPSHRRCQSGTRTPASGKGRSPPTRTPCCRKLAATASASTARTMGASSSQSSPRSDRRAGIASIPAGATSEPGGDIPSYLGRAEALVKPLPRGPAAGDSA